MTIGQIYFASDGEHIKIGYSENPRRRMGGLRSGSAQEITLLATVPGTVEIEKSLHERLRHLHVRGEWFKDRNYEIVHLIEKLQSALPDQPRLSLFPYVDDIDFWYDELTLRVERLIDEPGSSERRKRILKRRVLADLLESGGGSMQMRDTARDLWRSIEDGTHPLFDDANVAAFMRPRKRQGEGASL